MTPAMKEKVEAKARELFAFTGEGILWVARSDLGRRPYINLAKHVLAMECKARLEEVTAFPEVIYNSIKRTNELNDELSQLEGDL